MSSDNFVFGLVQDLGTFLMQLRDNLDSPERFAIFMRKLGWDVSLNSANMTQIQNMFSVNDLDTKIIQPLVKIIMNGTSPTMNDYGSILDALITIIKTIQNFSKNPPINNIQPFVAGFDWLEFSTDLIGSLICEYLESRKPTLFIMLRVLGLIDTQSKNMTGIAGRVSYVKKNIRLDRLPNLVNANKLLVDVYKWKTPFDSKIFLDSLKDLLDSIWLYASYDANNANQLDIPIMKADNAEDGKIDVSILVSTLPDDGSGQPGILVSPSLTGMPNEIDLGNFVFKLEGIQLGNSLGLKIKPKQITISATNPISNTMAVSLSYKPNNPIFIFGNAQSTNLNISDCVVRVSISNPASDPELIISLDFDNVQLSIDTSNSDSFIQEIIGNLIPSMSIQDFGIKWSSKYGLAFKGKPSLQATIGIHKSIGSVSIDSLFIGFSEDNSNLILSLAVSGNAQLGPINATVDQIGIKLIIKSQLIDNNAQDSKNSLPLSLEFKPPNGLGLAIDAEIAKGGGYIFFDTDKEEYAGILEVAVELPMEEVQVKLIGLLDTKMPDGSEGFSFLLIITVEFPAIQLGFGFTLNGLGGLVGINRTMSIDALRTGVKNHTLNNILFPEDPIIPKAPQIISEVSSIFPIAQDRFVFGPMLKLGWEEILTAEIGVVLEIPEPIRIALLGIIKVVLPPDADADVIIINIDILGIIDFEKKKFSLDGSLYDSRIVIFSLAGDMALRLGWGDEPTFALSVGGLNPHFQPPPDFPILRRLAISVSYEEVNLSLDTYLAVTSNTIQFGAHLKLTAAIAGFDLDGHFGFDVLIILSPFSFIADMQAGVELKKGGSTLMCIDLELTLTGPTPWHGYGKATFSILFFSVTAHVDITVGDPAQSQPLSPVQVLSKLTDALQASRNWTGSMPGDLERAVTFASLPTDDKIILVHPLSNLAFHQKEVPLGLTITQFGSGKPADADYFDIVDVKINDNPVTNQPAYDYFAMGQFQTMSDADKLSAPSFVQKRSGMTIGITSVDKGTVSNLELGYETFIVDDLNIPATKLNAIYKMSLDKQFALGRCSAASLSAVRTTGAAKYAAPGNMISTSDPKYVIASTENLSIRNDLVNQNGTDWADANAKLKTHLSVHPEDFGKVQIMSVHEVVSLA